MLTSDNDPHVWRKRAKTLEEMAKSLRNEADRQAMMNMPQHWAERADDAENKQAATRR